ncbi:exosome complex component RRP40 isoform X2 [Athalia rosae]|uniref:exosome complex component RRP40 isoform X2 n=1 Tax=Athalia rosae TaxID=37344 RepID=UPI002033A838|nr:exosome complex component RRP40 isoform X2 [Athalia rosae]
MEVSVDKVVVPGDVVEEIRTTNDRERVILGPGLRRDGELVLTTKAGVLRKRKPTIYYVDSYQKRYVPSRGENVVGIVTQKVGDIFRVDIGGGEQASLSHLAFEGATKKNRPDIAVGDVIFAKLLVASKDMEPELICVDSHGKRALLAKEQAYEIAIGMNGKVWIKARSIRETIAGINAILAAEYTAPKDMPALCSNITRTLFETS